MTFIETNRIMLLNVTIGDKMKVLTLREMKKTERMVQVMVRLPSATRMKIRSITESLGVRESEVLRSAIMFFLDEYFTKSNESGSEK
ncbi:MAG: hypothetical protein HS103_13650 [Anaerolineales bacterium]|nr:hypothetical protein [Anaerolineales bacterium]